MNVIKCRKCFSNVSVNYICSVKIKYMNTSFKLELNNKPKKDKTTDIFLRVTQGRKLKRISTGISVFEKDFNKNAEYGKWVRRTNPDYRRLNECLKKEIKNAEEALGRIEDKRTVVSLDNLISELQGQFSESFIEFYEEKLNQYKNTKSISYNKHMESKLNNLKEYLGKKDLMFSELDVSFLNKYHSFLMSKERKKGPLNSNSAASNLKAIRTIVYNAIDEGVDIKNPFDKIKLKDSKVNRKKLSIENITNLESLNLEKNSVLWHTLNYFLFAFYVAGTRISDIANLKWKNIQGNRLSFIMEKTDEGQTIHLHPKALIILNYYKTKNCGSETYVFPILRDLPTDADELVTFKFLECKKAKINRDLKRIQKIAGIDVNIHFHISRHSFADIMRTKKISIYDISKLLGHSDIKITERYFRGFDNLTSDEALLSGLDF